MPGAFWTRMPELGRINRVARYALAFVFIYHGLVPKILRTDTFETAWASAHHIPMSATLFAVLAGVAKIAIGLFIAIARRWLAPVYIAAALLIGLSIDVAIVAPASLTAAFNPVTTNIASLALCAIICSSQAAVRR